MKKSMITSKWYSRDLGFAGAMAEFLANMVGVVIPSGSFAERRARDEYLLLVEHPQEVVELVDVPSTTILCPSYPFAPSGRIIAERPRRSRYFRFLDKEDRSLLVGDGLQKTVEGSRDIRVSGRCITTGCIHWTGSSCRLGNAVASVHVRVRTAKNCSIRETCRWYLENSSNACKTCKYLPYSTLFDFVQIDGKVSM